MLRSLPANNFLGKSFFQRYSDRSRTTCSSPVARLTPSVRWRISGRQTLRQTSLAALSLDRPVQFRRQHVESLDGLVDRLLGRPTLVESGVVVRERPAHVCERAVECIRHVCGRLPAVDNAGGDVSYADSRTVGPWLAAEDRILSNTARTRPPTRSRLYVRSGTMRCPARSNRCHSRRARGGRRLSLSTACPASTTGGRFETRLSIRVVWIQIA